MFKFIIIGFTGSGKSTTARSIKQLFERAGKTVQLYETDKLALERFTRDSPIVEEFEKEKGISIPDSMFREEDKIIAFYKKFGEKLCRDLEYKIVESLIKELFNENTLFDLGGKVSTREDTQALFRDQQIIPIFLYTDHDVIIQRLTQENAWKERAAYRILGEDKWQEKAAENRRTLLEKYVQSAEVIISVDEFEKTPEEVAKEVLYSLAHLKIACQERENSHLHSIKETFFSRRSQRGEAPSRATLAR